MIFIYKFIYTDCFNVKTRSPAVDEGPRDAGVPVEILSAVERLSRQADTDTRSVLVTLGV